MCSSLSSVIAHSDTKFKMLCIKNDPAIKLLQQLMRKKDAVCLLYEKYCEKWCSLLARHQTTTLMCQFMSSWFASLPIMTVVVCDVITGNGLTLKSCKDKKKKKISINHWGWDMILTMYWLYSCACILEQRQSSRETRGTPEGANTYWMRYK